jgi:hypothetical protein
VRPALRRSIAATCVMLALGCPADAAIGAISTATTKADPAKEAKKLDLEIDKLEQDTGWLPFVPLVTVLVAALGGGRYFIDRRRARKQQIENDIRQSLADLNEAPDSAANASGKAATALMHLTGLTALKEADKARKNEVTAAVAEMVDTGLLEFDTPARAYFPVLCLNHWAPYAARFDDDPATCRALLARYRVSLNRVRVNNPGYVTAATRDAGGTYTANIPISEPDRLLLQALIEGYRAHLERLEGPARAEELAAFGVTMRRTDILV